MERGVCVSPRCDLPVCHSKYSQTLTSSDIKGLQPYHQCIGVCDLTAVQGVLYCSTHIMFLCQEADKKIGCIVVSTGLEQCLTGWV